jgi:hypothetical protein
MIEGEQERIREKRGRGGGGGGEVGGIYASAIGWYLIPSWNAYSASKIYQRLLTSSRQREKSK